MNTKEAIEVLKQHKSTTDKFNHTVGNVKVSEAIDTVVAVLERQELYKEMLSKISTKEYGEDGVGLSKEDLDECLYK